MMGYLTPALGDRPSHACFEGFHGRCTPNEMLCRPTGLSAFWRDIDGPCTCACHWAVTNHCATGEHLTCHYHRRSVDPRDMYSYWVNCPCPCHKILLGQELLELRQRVAG